MERFLAHAIRVWGLKRDDLFGHREFKPTECPGERLFTWFKGYHDRHAL